MITYAGHRDPKTTLVYLHLSGADLTAKMAHSVGSLKAELVQECLQPGATVSSVAISRGINANVIRKWLPLYRDQPPAALPAFVPVRATPKRAAEAFAFIELSLGGQSAMVKWPASDPAGCARFVRGLAQ